MPVDLGGLLRPNSAAVFASDPAGIGRVVAFLVTNLIGPGDNGMRLDLTKSVSVSSRATVARNPVERAVGTNIRKEPERITIQGSVSATPLGLFATFTGLFGSLIRRDLGEVEKLRTLQERGEPLVLVIPARTYTSVALENIEEVHPGSNKVDLSLTFRELEVVSPLAVAGAVALDALLAGASAPTDAGIQPTAAVPDPGGLG